MREKILGICLSPADEKTKRLYIEQLAVKHPDAFARLVAKILPAEMKLEGSLDLTMALRDMSAEELQRLAHATGGEEG